MNLLLHIRKGIARLTLVAAAAAIALGVPTSAGATVITTGGATGSAYVRCNTMTRSVDLNIGMFAERGYPTQGVAETYRIYDYNTRAYSPWAPWNVGTVRAGSSMNFMALASLPGVTHQVAVQVQYGWLRTTGWVYANEWVTTFHQDQPYGGSLTSSACFA